MHARMLLFSGKAAEAEKEMRQLVAANPDQFKALAYLGMMLYYEGKLDEAESELDRAVALGHDSEDDSARLLSAFLSASRGEGRRSMPACSNTVPNRSSTATALTGWAESMPCSAIDRVRSIGSSGRSHSEIRITLGLSGTRTTTLCEPTRSTRR